MRKSNTTARKPYIQVSYKIEHIITIFWKEIVICTEEYENENPSVCKDVRTSLNDNMQRKISSEYIAFRKLKKERIEDFGKAKKNCMENFELFLKKSPSKTIAMYFA